MAVLAGWHGLVCGWYLARVRAVSALGAAGGSQNCLGGGIAEELLQVMRVMRRRLPTLT